jgi:hypothetical protein
MERVTKKKVVRRKAVPKKVIAKKTVRKKQTRANVIKPRSTEDLLVENFVSLQKVMVNLSSKFDNLSKRMESLLDLFEISAKALAEKDININAKSGDSRKVMEKIDTLVDQNKIIARGLTLLHEKGENEEQETLKEPVPKIPLPEESPIGGNKTQDIGESMAGYEKSIYSKHKNIPEKRRFSKLPRL